MEFDEDVKNLIDETVVIEFKQSSDNSNSNQEPTLDEEDFLISFLQTQLIASEDALAIIFDIIDSSHDGKLSFKDFVLFIKATYLFINYQAPRQKLLSFTDMEKGTQSYQCPIGLSQEDVAILADITLFTQSNNITYKQFLAFFFLPVQFKEFGLVEFVTEQNLIKGLNRLGLAINDLSQVSSTKDLQTGNMVYNYKQAFRQVTELESQQIRDKILEEEAA